MRNALCWSSPTGLCIKLKRASVTAVRHPGKAAHAPPGRLTAGLQLAEGCHLIKWSVCLTDFFNFCLMVSIKEMALTVRRLRHITVDQNS